jgi:hypothetical protein
VLLPFLPLRAPALIKGPFVYGKAPSTNEEGRPGLALHWVCWPMHF